MAKPAVILVGADKGGVGKTTVARTLLDYFTAHQVPIRAFDTEAPRGTLKRFHPDITEVVDVTQVADQMKIFDTLANATADVTVIDVRAGLLSSTLRALNEIGFLDSAKKGQITFAVFHILGPSIASLDEIAETAKTVGDANYFLVKNFINNTTFFEWDPAIYSSYFNRIKGAQDITVAKLNEMACEQVEVAGVPFVSFVANKGPGGDAANNSFVLRGYVRHWLGNVWSEYDRVKLMDLIAPKEDGSMRQAAS
jgi:MinD-like ATPase involved in chromosome partitioning or flagellar assembly